MKIVNYLLLITFVALLIYASSGLPNRGDVDATMHREKSPAGSPGASSYYIRNAYKDANTPNMVTVILADYRGYDTLGEETVILTAGLICYLILRKKRTRS
ncbi:MAG TPA: hydrogen gas-evolving membrane-bound hydrogenase subunit E [Syntrophales bacterium]|nr:hydrogen gas-evolving membrane-bound hydrogenase subunit E [Syntrophales bacterium]HLE16805.1 hydrogen gas-evolving membrane-bound hydrogenase subunit E [Syntrophales bacterium]